MFNNKRMFTVRFHGYGGQGVKTIANLLGKAAIANGIYAQAFPEFGPERRGAPVKAFARFSMEPITTRSEIEKPDFIVVMDQNILNLPEVRKGAGSDTNYLIQTDFPAVEIKNKYSLMPERHHIYCIDSESAVSEYQNQVHLSIPMIGKFIQVTELVPLDTIKEVIKKEFIDKIGEEKTILTEKALEEAYQQV
ncbi:MAG: 2-oxoacid:acceptor oxidoreductase family protein [Candidatus Moraniibacteriota bacterium]